MDVSSEKRLIAHLSTHVVMYDGVSEAVAVGAVVVV